MQGVIKSYKPKNGYGFIEAEDGNDYFFLRSELVGIEEDGYYIQGWGVTFDAVEESERTHDSAVNIVFLEKPVKKPDPTKVLVPDEDRTGFGKWSKTNKGRYRCSDCHCDFPTMEKFCPFCGAKMADRKGRKMSYRASNMPNIERSRDPNKSPTGKWIPVGEKEFECNKCHHISPKPWKSCGECGNWMAKLEK